MTDPSSGTERAIRLLAANWPVSIEVVAAMMRHCAALAEAEAFTAIAEGLRKVGERTAAGLVLRLSLERLGETQAKIAERRKVSGEGVCGELMQMIKYRHTLNGNRKPITKIEDPRGCLICTSHTPGTHGYPMLWGRGCAHHMHRLLYEELHGVILPSAVVVRHTCDNRLCINPDHWLPGSQSDNARDRVERGRNNIHRGETRSDAKLSAEQVLQVRASSSSQYKLAKLLGVNQSTISRVRSMQRRKFG